MCGFHKFARIHTRTESKDVHYQHYFLGKFFGSGQNHPPVLSQSPAFLSLPSTLNFVHCFCFLKQTRIASLCEHCEAFVCCNKLTVGPSNMSPHPQGPPPPPPNVKVSAASTGDPHDQDLVRLSLDISYGKSIGVGLLRVADEPRQPKLEAKEEERQ